MELYYTSPRPVILKAHKVVAVFCFYTLMSFCLFDSLPCFPSLLCQPPSTASLPLNPSSNIQHLCKFHFASFALPFPQLCYPLAFFCFEPWLSRDEKLIFVSPFLPLSPFSLHHSVCLTAFLPSAPPTPPHFNPESSSDTARNCSNKMLMVC